MVFQSVFPRGDVFTVLGVLLIILGIVLVAIPILSGIPAVMNTVDRVPWILLYVYRHENFVFATSPALILISLAYFFLSLLKQFR
jgi:hypothetical protein